MQGPLIRLPERTRLVFDCLALVGMMLGLLTVVLFLIMALQDELTGNGHGLAATLVLGVGLFGLKVALHEGERRGTVSFLSAKQEAESLSRGSLRLPDPDAALGAARPEAVSRTSPPPEPAPDDGAGAVFILALLALVAAGAVSLFAVPLSDRQGVKFLATAVAAVPAALFLLYRGWRALRLVRKDWKE